MMVMHSGINIREDKINIVDFDGRILSLTAHQAKRAAVFEWVMFGSTLGFQDVDSAESFLEAFPEIKEAGGRVVHRVNGKILSMRRDTPPGIALA